MSKQTFDAAFIQEGQGVGTTALSALPAAVFKRTAQGVQRFVQWLDARMECSDEPETPVRCVMEATGRYSTELAVWLIEQRSSLAPAIAPPSQTSAFIASLGVRTMTDKVAARGLAVYGMERQPQPYEPRSPLERELREVSRYRDFLVGERTAASNRAGERCSSRLVRQNQAKRLRLLDGDIQRAEAEMRRLVNQSPELRRDIALLSTIRGVAFLTAAVVRAELGDLRRFERARELSAFTGLCTSSSTSGTSVRKGGRMSKKGNPRVRQALYLSSMVAIQHENSFRRTYRHLLANGKEPMVGLGAVMRKILCVMRAILISEIPYDPNWGGGGKLTHGET